MAMEQTPHIALLPSPGIGHLIPIVEFSKRLILHHHFTATLILPTDGPLSKPQETLLEALPAGMDHVLLPPVNFDDLPEDVRIETRISLTVERSLPFIRDVIKPLVAKTKLAALVVDHFATDAFDVANEFKISPYMFYPSTAMCLSLSLYLPLLHEMVSCEYRDLLEPVQIPGCIPIHGKELLDPVQDRNNDAYKYFLHNCKRYMMAEGIIVNSFTDLEPGPIKALQQKWPPLYPVGPVIQTKPSSAATNTSGEGHCLKWLDDQPRGSVLFISFGSGGTLSHEQFIELAEGLELSEQRFLWVVRCPNEGVTNATYFNVQFQNDPLAYLPQGFLERTKGRGLLVPFWAPQERILAHESTGGFLTHCGWNSVLESVVHGVPLIVWPLYAEQKMNAIMLTNDLKVALRPKVKENGVVERDEIANVAKELIEGEEVEGKRLRSRTTNLKDAASRMLSEGGSSSKALAELASIWKKKIST